MQESDWTMSFRNERLKKLFRPPAILAFKVLSWVECKIWAEPQLRYSPVFIVAPPRAGTTLLYQLMAGNLSTSYFTNLAMRLQVKGSPVVPIIGAKLVKFLKLKPNSSAAFESYYGATKGLAGPHEGNWVWNQWFPEDVHHVPPGYLSTKAQKNIHRAVAGTERVFGRPFVNKRIRNSVRIEALAEIFPTAIFIQCTRDPLDIAQSIYIARTHDFPFQDKCTKDPSQWWSSVKPREYETIVKKGLIEQVCEQIYFVEQHIDRARDALGDDRFLEIDYKSLCQAPRREIDRVIEFMNANNAPTCILKPIPAAFSYSTGRKIDRGTYCALAEYLSELYQRAIGCSDAEFGKTINPVSRLPANVAHPLRAFGDRLESGP